MSDLRSLATLAGLALFNLAACSSASSEPAATGSQALSPEPAATSSQAPATPDLAWVGSTQIAYAVPVAGPTETDVAVPDSFVVAGNDLTVLTDTYPEQSAQTVTLYWANSDYSSTGSVAMTLVRSGDGPYQDDDLYRGVIPGAALAGGQATHYWVSADDANGQTLYDSQNGANYTLVPRGLSVGWAGDLGAYDAQGGFGFYTVGKLFNADLSTTEGCWENGYDDYPVQAVQVYVPGLTDQDYTGDLARAASSVVLAQLWTDMRPDGWGPVATSCRGPVIVNEATGAVGNNYVCDIPLTVFPASAQAGCLPDGNVAAGDYEYKLRFSVDGGNTWYWVGSIDGGGGGANLRVHYDPNCAFATNDPTTCVARN